MNAGLVLLYHRVAELRTDPQLLAVTPSHFDEHLAMLRARGTPMRLDQMLIAARERRLPPRSFAVTFDDGYADNWDNAEPLLARYDVPATVFIASGYVDEVREFWWDELEHSLLSGDDCANWNAESEADPSPRHREYRRACQELRNASARDRRSALDAFAARQSAAVTARVTHRVVTAERLARTAGRGLLEIGAHTVSHPALAARPTTEQFQEIEESRTILRDIIGDEPRGFSYPFGGRRDYTRTTVRLVREAGFDFACVNVTGLVDVRTDPHQVPRMLVRDCDGDTLGARLEQQGW